jgi:hypothetical protein
MPRTSSPPTPPARTSPTSLGQVVARYGAPIVANIDAAVDDLNAQQRLWALK